nr:uncharacterized protein LOC106691187 [Halyomorpha halys]
MKPFSYSRFTALLLDSFSEPQPHENTERMENTVKTNEKPKEKKEKPYKIKRGQHQTDNKGRKKRRITSKSRRKNQRIYCSKCCPKFEVNSCCINVKKKSSKTNAKQTRAPQYANIKAKQGRYMEKVDPIRIKEMIRFMVKKKKY